MSKGHRKNSLAFRAQAPLEWRKVGRTTNPALGSNPLQGTVLYGREFISIGRA